MLSKTPENQYIYTGRLIRSGVYQNAAADKPLTRSSTVFKDALLCTCTRSYGFIASATFICGRNMYKVNIRRSPRYITMMSAFTMESECIPQDCIENVLILLEQRERKV
jgi:hypothetical protein